MCIDKQHTNDYSAGLKLLQTECYRNAALERMSESLWEVPTISSDILICLIFFFFANFCVCYQLPDLYPSQVGSCHVRLLYLINTFRLTDSYK